MERDELRITVGRLALGKTRNNRGTIGCTRK
jgi:hypothetical protein